MQATSTGQAYDQLTWNEKIAFNIEIRRRELKMTRSDLQKKTSISRHQYNGMVFKGVPIAAETLELMAIALNCPVEMLKPPYEVT